MSNVFDKALERAMAFFPGIAIKKEQESCLRSLVVDKKDVMAILPTGYGKSMVYQLPPKLSSELNFEKNGVREVFTVTVVSPLELIRKQQVERLNSMGIKTTSLDNSKPRILETGYEIIVRKHGAIRRVEKSY